MAVWVDGWVGDGVGDWAAVVVAVAVAAAVNVCGVCVEGRRGEEEPNDDHI